MGADPDTRRAVVGTQSPTNRTARRGPSCKFVLAKIRKKQNKDQSCGAGAVLYR